MTFTIFDIFILTIVTISSFLGMYKGLINITIHLIGFIFAIIVAILIYPYIKILLSNHIENELIVSIAGGITSYIGSLITFTYLTSKIILLFTDKSCGPFDRFLGLLVGFLRGWLIALLVFAVVAITSAGNYFEADNAEDLISNLSAEQYPAWLLDSRTTKYLEKSLKTIVVMLPEDLLKSINMPKTDKEKDENIIDSIKRKKKDAQSSIIVPFDKDLEKAIEEEPHKQK